MERPSVHVVGAGIVGLATAAVLVERGVRVTLYDRTGPGAEASRGNAGGLAWTDVAPLAGPGMWKQALKWMLDPLGPLTVRPTYAFSILPWMLHFMAACKRSDLTAHTEAIAAINAAAAPAWEHLWRLTGTLEQVNRGGCLEVFDDPHQLTEARAVWQEQRDYGVKVLELSGNELRELEPDLTERALGGAFEPDWATMDDPLKLCRSLADWLKAQDVSIETGDVIAVQSRGDGAELVFKDGRHVEAEKVVIAAGAWSKPLAAGLGDSIPLDTERGYNITVPKPGVTLSHFVLLPGHGFAISHLTSGLRIGGAVEFGGLKLPANWKRVDAMVTKASRVLRDLDASKGERWMGFRPSLPDSMPVISPAKANPNVVYAFGHAHHGLTQSAVTGQMVAAMLFGEKPVIDPAPYCASRF